MNLQFLPLSMALGDHNLLPWGQLGARIETHTPSLHLSWSSRGMWWQGTGEWGTL